MGDAIKVDGGRTGTDEIPSIGRCLDRDEIENAVQK